MYVWMISTALKDGCFFRYFRLFLSVKLILHETATLELHLGFLKLVKLLVVFIRMGLGALYHPAMSATLCGSRCFSFAMGESRD